MAGRLAVFHRAVQLLDPVIRGVFAEADAMFLEGTGGVSPHSVEVPTQLQPRHLRGSTAGD